MKTTVAVELDGGTFMLDEAAFATLRAYLDKAAERLGDHPDRAEVLAGLERSISAQLGRNRGAQAPIRERELSGALAGVGRVDGPRLGARSHDAHSRTSGRRLCRLREGQMVAGVCTGLAAFAGIDVSLIRAAFVLGTVFSGGALLVAYMASVFLVPVARTPEETAAAYGERNASTTQSR